MYNHCVHFLDSNGRLYQYQFGFRRGHSTQQAIITVLAGQWRPGNWSVFGL